MDRRQQKTKIAIHQAMTTLLKKKKFEALTVQDIIDEANIGRSTFYSHFETKEELLELLLREYDVEEDIAKGDIENFISELINVG